MQLQSQKDAGERRKRQPFSSKREGQGNVSYHCTQIRKTLRGSSETSQFLTKKQPGELRAKMDLEIVKSESQRSVGGRLANPLFHKLGENLQ